MQMLLPRRRGGSGEAERRKPTRRIWTSKSVPTSLSVANAGRQTSCHIIYSGHGAFFAAQQPVCFVSLVPPSHRSSLAAALVVPCPRPLAACHSSPCPSRYLKPRWRSRCGHRDSFFDSAAVMRIVPVAPT